MEILLTEACVVFGVTCLPCIGWKDHACYQRNFYPNPFLMKAIPGVSDSKESSCNAGDLGLIPGLERSLGEGNGNPLLMNAL